MIVLLSALAAALPVRAQNRCRVTPYLPLDQWVAPVLRRLDALGLLPAGADIATRSPDRGRVVRWLARADSLAGRDRPEVAHLVHGYHLLLAREFPATAAAMTTPSSTCAGPGIEVGLSTDLAGASGQLVPGAFDSLRSWQGPIRRMQQTALGFEVDGAILATTWLAAAASVRWKETAVAADEAYAAARVAALDLWVGRRQLGFAPGAGGGLVLQHARFDGGGFQPAHPFLLPGPLQLLGPVHLTTALGRAGANGLVPHPWLWVARVTMAPHRRLTMGGTRATLWGDSAGGPFRPGDFARVLIAKRLTGARYDDHVFSADVRYRPPTGAWPLVLYGEWGSDDSVGGAFYVPGLVLGAELAAVPGFPGLAVTLEHTSLATACCTHPPWYHHFELASGWTDRGTLLGHPLGGNGSEWLLVTHLDPRDAHWRLAAQLSRRWRGAENLFAPDRQGRSEGAAVQIAFRLLPRLELSTRGFLEVGAGWHETQGFIGLRGVF